MTENLLTGHRVHTCSAYLTFVSLDEAGKPTLAPQVIPETEEEKRRYRDAGQRREYRLAQRQRAERRATV
jgi:acyl-CoA hydrolase